MKFLRSILSTFFFLLLTFYIQAQTSNYISHTIVSGETLSAIAKQYHTTVGDIMRLNRMGTKSVLTIGEVVKIPTAQTSASAKPTTTAEQPNVTTITPQVTIIKNDSLAAPANGVPRIHIVGKGESLYSLAKEFHTTIAQLKSWNNMTGNVILDGHKIIVGYTPTATITPYSTTQNMRPATTPTIQTATSTEKETIQSSPAIQQQQPFQPVQEKTIVQTEPQVQPSVVNNNPPSTVQTTTTNIPSSTTTTEKTAIPTVSTSQPSQNKVANMNNPEGYFTSAFGLGTEGRSIQTATGTSMTFKTASGWNDKKYYILMNDVPPGSIVKIMAPNYKTIYAKVLWGMSTMKENTGLDYRISTAAAAALGLSEAKFQLTITYFE